MSCRRAIHFVFKIGKRNESIGFYKNVLGMKVLQLSADFQTPVHRYFNIHRLLLQMNEESERILN